MSNPDQPSSRGPVQWIIAVCFGLLSVAFFFRFLQSGYKWLRHVVEADNNFKALTIWALVYTVVCGVIAAIVYHLPRDSGDEPAQNGERGT